MPGETKTCNGCHVAGNKTSPSHGRAGLTASVNRAHPPRCAVPEHTGQSARANAGDTWRTPQLEHGLPDDGCNVLGDSERRRDLRRRMDRSGKAGRAKDASFSYLYSLLSTLKPPMRTARPGIPCAAAPSTIRFTSSRFGNSLA